MKKTVLYDSFFGINFKRKKRVDSKFILLKQVVCR